VGLPGQAGRVEGRHQMPSRHAMPINRVALFSEQTWFRTLYLDSI